MFSEKKSKKDENNETIRKKDIKKNQLNDNNIKSKTEEENNDELKLELKNLREEMGQKTALYYKNEFTLNRKDKFNKMSGM